MQNLTFHGVGEPPRALDPEEAEAWLSTDRLLEALDAVTSRPDVRITFDDGNRSDVEIALPALLERGLEATFFVLAGRLDDPHHLGASDLLTLTRAGMRVGSHGLCHNDWRSLGPGELSGEIVDSRRILERVLDRPVTEASIPFGSYDRRVLTRLRDAGYERVFTSDGGMARPGTWLQPRTTVERTTRRATLAAPPTPADRLRRALKRCVKRWR